MYICFLTTKLIAEQKRFAQMHAVIDETLIRGERIGWLTHFVVFMWNKLDENFIVLIDITKRSKMQWFIFKATHTQQNFEQE